MTITSAVLAEICSSLPLSGSIYIWAAASAGPKHARFFGFLVAWWSCAAWMTFVTSLCQVWFGLNSGCPIVQCPRLTLYVYDQVAANYIASQLSVWEIDFPGGTHDENVKWRAFIWALSEGILVLAVAINYLPPRLYSLFFKLSLVLCFIDFSLCLIWLPIGVSRKYGFRSVKDVFTATCQCPL
jgi:translation initiation factor 5B